MAIKDFVHQFRPVQLYIVLVLSICYFSLQMVLSHITHALTLLMASYHMLCNIFALTGCILTIKHSKRTETDEGIDCNIANKCNRVSMNGDDKFTCTDITIEEQSLRKIECRERKLKNTFGWTRIDVLTMLIVCIILASLCFSLLVEALQTLVHIDHQDSMHLPVPVMVLGFFGLMLNGVCYLLIGGYTMNQGSFLHVTPEGNVVLDDEVSTDEKVKNNIGRDISISKISEVDTPNDDNSNGQKNKQGFIEMFRDVSSTTFVIVCAFIVYISTDEHTAKFIDPILSIFSCVVLVTLSYPYMKESCLILLQTIPGSIDMDNFEQTLSSKFPEIISYHDLHIWQLTANKYVSTVHIKFKSQQHYTKIIEDVKCFFFDQGITIVTIQPEFEETSSTAYLECLVQCNANDCAEKVCCQQSKIDLHEIIGPDSPKDEDQSIEYKSKQQEHQRITSNLNEILQKSQSADNLNDSEATGNEHRSNFEQDICQSKLPSEENKIVTIDISSSLSSSTNPNEETKTAYY